MLPANQPLRLQHFFQIASATPHFQIKAHFILKSGTSIKGLSDHSAEWLKTLQCTCVLTSSPHAELLDLNSDRPP